MSDDQDAKSAPIVDPLAEVRSISESERGVLEVLAERARWLSFACFGSAAMSIVVSVVAAVGRLDLGILLYLLPTAVANAVVGLFLKNGASSLARAASDKLKDRVPLFGGLQLFSKAFVVQLFSVGFLMLLLVVALVVAASVRKVTEL
jgi:hypothetical protein